MKRLDEEAAVLIGLCQSKFTNKKWSHLPINTPQAEAEKLLLDENSDASMKDQDQAVDINLGPSPSTSQADTVPDQNAMKSYPLRRPRGQIARRHSTQLSSSGISHPAEGGAEDATAQPSVISKKLLRRSLSTRVMLGMTTTSLVPRLSFASGFNAIASKVSAPADGDDSGNHPPETPYEEMMVRFQIRQLQRTASTRSEDRRGIATSSRGTVHDGLGAGSDPASITSGGLAGRTTGGQAQELNIHPRLSTREISDHVSSTQDPGGRVASFHRNADRTSYNNSVTGGHFPFESGTSSAQLAEQFNLAYGSVDGPDGRQYRSNHSAWRRVLVPILRKLVKPISPYSRISQVRYTLTLLVTVTYVLWFPLELAFPNQHQLTNVDAVIGVVLCLDIVMTLHTGYVTPTGAIVISHWFILWHYIKTRLVVDVVLSVPLLLHINRSNTKYFGGKWMTFVLDVLSVERLAYIARFVRMIWLIRANQSGGGNNFWAWLLYSRYSHLLRIAGIVTMLIAIAHYIACVWTVLLEESVSFDQSAMSWKEQYSASFYSALLLLQGEGVPTDTAGQNLFASLSVLVGSIVLAVVFGHVAILVANFNANFTSYQRKMEAVFAVTAKLQLPAQLRERIHEYYEHLWHEYECLDGEIVQFSKELSHTLGLEVVLFKYMELVMHVPFWKECTPDFQKQLMLRLDVRVYLPNDFIMREGEVDDEFYMVNRGYCELNRAINRFERVTNTMIMGGRGTGLNTSRITGLTSRRRSALNGGQLDGDIRQSAYELDAAQRQYYNNNGGRGRHEYEVVISRGQAFGDLALLMNYQRAANVRAVTHVEMCVLSRENFQVVLARYPEDRRRVVVDMLTSYMQSYEADQSRCPLLELVHTVYSPEAITAVYARAGWAPPFLPSQLTARQAAERVFTAIDTDQKDSTLKFGVGVNIREQLIALRERRRQKLKTKQQVPGSNLAMSHNRTTAGTEGSTTSSQSRYSSLALTQSENASNATSAESTLSQQGVIAPPAVVSLATEDHTGSNATQQISWQKRLQQIEKREVTILHELQKLQSSLRVLRARQSVQMPSSLPTRKRSSLPTRKRSAPGCDVAIANATELARPPLLQRMGSLVGLSSGSALDSKAQQEPKESPTRYADELFNSHAPSATAFRSPTLPQEIEKFLAMTEASLLTTRPSSDSFASELNGLFDSQPPLASLPTEVQHQKRKAFQRSRSRSLHELEEKYQASTNPSKAPADTNTGAADQQRKKMFYRTQSQSVRAIANAAATQIVAPRGSVGSLSTAQTRILQRMSTFVADPSGKQSPTRYADALFSRRMIDPKDESGSNTPL
ncbi:unnamed protein product [Phytophthora lilii]|uniref:Unnamed protein product n=1 Tax=Phytophthora lilii TaxID=2077276 RepID=A0A9W6WXF2_9STRA|nr:unnamed protein product [Phytophthora lilii]